MGSDGEMMIELLMQEEADAAADQEEPMVLATLLCY
jgi:hypothetical protein